MNRVIGHSKADMSIRAGTAELAAFAGQLRFQDLLKGEAEQGAWRLVEAFSEGGQPFELEARWSAGTGSGASIKLTIAHASRVCLFARSLTLSVANLTNSLNRVGVTVADGFAPTANVWEYRATCDGVTAVRVPVPPFALFLQAHLADRTALPGSIISLFDGMGALMSQYSGTSQPGSGIPVGGAGRIEILTSSATNLRGVFHLSV